MGTFFAVALQIYIAYGFKRKWVAGAAVASAWAVSREIAQAGCRWIKITATGCVTTCHGGRACWQRLGPWLDWALPCAGGDNNCCAGGQGQQFSGKIVRSFGRY